jgi:aminodeoxychorismate lyase
MIVFVNGQLLPEEQAVVSVLDRGFLYGDGLFETLTVWNGRPFRWQQHWKRFESGARFLKIVLPFTAADLHRSVEDLVRANQMPNALLRLTLSRGIGPRGYSPKGAERPSVVMSLHPAPPLAAMETPRWNLVTSNSRLPANEPLAQFKTCNKLPQIMARAEADAAGAQEALLLNSEGFVVEAASSNLFWVVGQIIHTPPLMSGILPGVTRAVVFELCGSSGLAVEETQIQLNDLRQVDGVFLSLSSLGIAEGLSLDGAGLRQSPLTEKLRRSYFDLLRRESDQA